MAKTTLYLGARLRGRTATQRSKIGVPRRFWEGFWGRGSQKASEKGAFIYGFYSKKRVLRRVLRRGSEKGASRRRPERPPEEYAPQACALFTTIYDVSQLKGS